MHASLLHVPVRWLHTGHALMLGIRTGRMLDIRLATSLTTMHG